MGVFITVLCKLPVTYLLTLSTYIHALAEVVLRASQNRFKWVYCFCTQKVNSSENEPKISQESRKIK